MKTNISASGDPAHVAMPCDHRVASLLKRWLLGTHQGGVSIRQLDFYLDEFVFRFNRRKRAKDWNVPLWNGEWDLFDASSPSPHDPTWQGDTRRTMGFYRQNGIGWAIWTYAQGSFLTATGEQAKPGMLDAVQQGCGTRRARRTPP